MQHTARGCNTLCCAAASHVCCAEGDVTEGSSGDTDVGLGMDLVPVQMCVGISSVPVQMWAGMDSVAVQMWAGVDSFAVQRWAMDRLSPAADVGGWVGGGGVGPGAEVGWYEPSPVVSDEHNPKR